MSGVHHAERLKMINALIENEIELIRTGLEIGDQTYLEFVLSDQGWKPCHTLTDEELIAEYNECIETPEQAR